MSFTLSADSNSEIPPRWEDEFNLMLLKMPYTLGGVEYEYDLGRNSDPKEFYDRLRKGEQSITAQRNPHEFISFWTPALERGEDILHVSFTSGLSGTYDCALLARKELLETFPERKIVIVDTLAISMPCGLLVREAHRLREQGKTIEETAEWIEHNKQRANAFFTVDDLAYLRRGGRVSGASALFGSMLEIKPILYISPDGKLVAIDRVKGRKKALRYLAQKTAERMEDPQNNTLCICQADCMEDALLCKKYVLELITPKEIMINPVGPVIGGHAGPGTLAVVFFGKERSV